MKAIQCHPQAEVSELRNNPEVAQAYLREAMQWIDQPDGRATCLMVLRALAHSHGDMTQIAKEAGIERQSLYRALSPNGNPTLNTLITAMKATVYLAMREKNINQSALARALNINEKEVRRMLDPGHPSKATTLEQALHHLGKRVVVGIESLDWP